MNNRLKCIRKQFHLTQEEFADRIGIKRGAISNYEIGRNEPIDAVISLICREFNVNEEWLRTGEGDMFRKISEADELEQILAAITVSDDETIKRIIRAYWRLSDNKKSVIRELIDNLVEKTEQALNPPASAIAFAASPDVGPENNEEGYNPDIEARVARYRKQLELEASTGIFEDSIQARTG